MQIIFGRILQNGSFTEGSSVEVLDGELPMAKFDGGGKNVDHILRLSINLAEANMPENEPFQFGDVIVLKHVLTQRFLTKTKQNSMSSPDQPLVGTTMDESRAIHWVVERESGQHSSSPKDGTPVRFRNVSASERLHSHSHQTESLVPPHKEVTLYNNDDGNRDDAWSIIIQNSSEWNEGSRFALMHVNTSDDLTRLFLQTSDGFRSDKIGEEERAALCMAHGVADQVEFSWQAINVTNQYPKRFGASFFKVGSCKILGSGLVMVVGPNSSGKTQMLLDIEHALRGKQRKLVVVESILLVKPHSIEGFLNQDSTLDPNDVRKLFRQWNPRQVVQNATNDQFLQTIGEKALAMLRIENRREITKTLAKYDPNKPVEDLEFLLADDAAMEGLSHEIFSIFNKTLKWDPYSGLSLRIIEGPTPAGFRETFSELAKLRKVEEEGDGLRSYLGMCVSLLLRRRFVYLIDEPELCLHPPQSYAMGRFIGKFASRESQLTLVSTHSSHIIRGVLSASTPFQILRLSKIRNQFVARLADERTVHECFTQPLVRAETVIDGIFSDGVIVVESENDRAVYQAAWDKFQPFTGDVAFTGAATGAGSMKSFAALYSKLGIPCVVIMDLDQIYLSSSVMAALIALGSNSSTAQKIRDECNRLPVAIAALPNSPKPNEFFKQGISGIKNESPPLGEAVEQIVEECAKLGLFFVPSGELENWCPTLQAGIDRRDKPAFANALAIRIRESPAQATDIADFVRRIGSFMQAMRDATR